MSQQDEEFKKKMAEVMYKTTYQKQCEAKTSLTADTGKGIDGRFTDHLIYSGMYHNASLNTTPDKDRWLNGSKDWMEHLS